GVIRLPPAASFSTASLSWIYQQYPSRTLSIDILKALPERPMCSIYDRAKFLGLKREEKRQGARPVLTHALNVTYADLEKAEALVVSEGDKEFMHNLTNRLAKQATRRRLACYWFLPIERLMLAPLGHASQEPDYSDLSLLIDGAIPLRWQRSSG